MKISLLIRKLQIDLATHGDIEVLTDSMNPNLNRVVITANNNHKYSYITNRINPVLIIILKQDLEIKDVLNKEKAPE